MSDIYQFDAFRKNNPHCTISIRRGEDGKGFAHIERPWDDSTLIIAVSEDDYDQFANNLSDVLLPPELSAIYHKQQRSLEVIWTCYRLSEKSSEIKDREFTFAHEGQEIFCKFGKSSETLLIISKFARPIVEAERTNFRNLRSFWMYSNMKSSEGRTVIGIDEPRSLWIHNVDYESDAILRLLRHLNFYLSYYDRDTPLVLLHETADGNPTDIRYLEGQFPAHVTSKPVEDNILSFWNSAHLTENPMLQYIIYYRIIEYCAFNFGRPDLKRSIKFHLSNPTRHWNAEKTANDIISIMNLEKEYSDVQRFEDLIRDAVRPSTLWKTIEKNKIFFSEKVKFEGGYSVAPLISKDCTDANFEPQGVTNVARTLRGIRNVLSHGKDFGSQGVILPSLANMSKLLPWTSLIRTVSGEVILYGPV